MKRRKLDYDWVHRCYSSNKIITLTKTRKFRSMGHVARKRQAKYHIHNVQRMLEEQRGYGKKNH